MTDPSSTLTVEHTIAGPVGYRGSVTRNWFTRRRARGFRLGQRCIRRLLRASRTGRWKHL